MTREFPEELLSGYLDGELSAAEQALVEQRLAANDADRQLVDELRSLRGDLAALPGVNIDAGFADRVVQAALAAQVSDVPPPLEVASRSSRQMRQWLYAAAVLAAAASLFIAIQPWRYSSTNAPAVVMSPQDAMISMLRSFAPTEGQALVVRLQVPKGAAGSLDAALAKAGIESLVSGGAANAHSVLANAYVQQVREKLAAGSAVASDALLVEAPLADIERALVAMAGDGKNRMNLLAETKLDWKRIQEGASGEGEGDKHRVVGTNSHPFAQHLDAAQFPLSSETVRAAAPTTVVPAPSVTGPVRVIILIEQIDAAR